MTEVTKDRAFEILLRLEEGYSEAGVMGQGIAASTLPTSELSGAFQLLINDGTIYRMTSVRTDDTLYFQRFATALVEMGLCHCPMEKRDEDRRDEVL